jgi:mono/diheme cytochrome c family protein
VASVYSVLTQVFHVSHVYIYTDRDNYFLLNIGHFAVGLNCQLGRQHMKRAILISIFILSTLLILSNCGHLSEGDYLGAKSDQVLAIRAAGDIPKRQELEQAWNDDIRTKFWFTSQGSRIMLYTWFTWLEQANNQNLFRDAQHMEELRYLPINSSNMNPAGLPIGFALDRDKKSGMAWVGLTCAACHTNQLDYQGTKILIEGAPTLANFVLFYQRLVSALDTTHRDDQKFKRFANRVLGTDYSQANSDELHSQLLNVAIKASERQQVNALPASYSRDFTSYARLDAFGNIQNAGTAFALHDLNNKNIPNAPVSYPFIWGTHQSDVVQWNASAPNTAVVGPLVRNMGEVVGVFGGLNIEQAAWWQRLVGIKVKYTSSVDMLGLGHLESWVKTLRSPQWPEQYLPPVNAVKAAKGKALYQAECVECHQVILRENESDHYVSVKTPVGGVGTDPAAAWNAANNRANTLILEGVKDKIVLGSRFKETAAAIDIPVNGVVGLVLERPLLALKAGLIPEKTNNKRFSDAKQTYDENSLKESLQVLVSAQKNIASTRLKAMKENKYAGLVYKARPLNGVWATAPYLHNGSVPTLWSLLQTPETRPVEFRVGNREFDPVNVGYNTELGPSIFNVLDVDGNTIAGNANSGHTYGTALTNDDKWALVEYMKTL